MEPPAPDPYEVLKIPPTATQASITAAYRKLARQLHPDVPGTGDRDAFIRLQQAYRQLGDADGRAAFDRSRRPTAARPAWRAGDASLGFTRAVTWRRPRFIVPLLLLATMLAVAQAVAVFWRAPAQVAVHAGTSQPTMQGTARVGPAQEAVQPAAVNPVPDRAALPPATDFAAADHFMTSGPPLPWGGAGGRLEPFTPVALIGVAHAARTEVRRGDGSVGLVDTGRLSPGGARAGVLPPAFTTPGRHHAPGRYWCTVPTAPPPSVRVVVAWSDFEISL